MPTLFNVKNCKHAALRKIDSNSSVCATGRWEMLSKAIEQLPGNRKLPGKAPITVMFPEENVPNGWGSYKSGK